MPDGIDLILADHQVVASLFDEFEPTQDAALVGVIIDQLTAHDDAEQQALYPLAAIVLDDAAALLDQSLLAHAAVKRQIDHLRAQEGAPFVDAVRVAPRSGRRARGRRGEAPAPCPAQGGHRPAARRARRPHPPSQAARRLTR